MSKKTERSESRHCAEDLLGAGLKLLETDSVQQLTIDALCRKLKVTKGSFYHHFKNRADFLERMLEHWVEGWTLASIEAADEGVDAVERFNLIVENHISSHQGLRPVYGRGLYMIRLHRSILSELTVFELNICVPF